MLSRWTLAACAILGLAAQLGCTSDPPPSVALREHEPSHPKLVAPLDAEVKQHEAKRDDIPPELPFPKGLEGLEIVVEQVGPAPLPYQWVRLRVTFHNKGKEAITDPRLLSPGMAFTAVKGPKDRALRRPGEGPYMLGPPQPSKNGLTYPSSRLGRMKQEERLTLQPGESISITGALGSYQAGDGVFDQPGDYLLQLRYVGKQSLLSAKPLTMTVGTPQGTDAEALKLLQKQNASLAGFTAAVRYDNIWLDKEYILKLKEIVDKHPKSSYADYARYLLTCRMGEKAFDKPAEAGQALESIDVKTFPFGANVLLTQRLWAQYDKAQLAKIDEKLDADFYDSDVWIEDQANRLSFAKLMELRKPPAERKKPEPVKP
jgi:hypothetical protein